MEKIKEFQIITLTLTNFKRFTETTTFNFGKLGRIYGDNGQGKSSIADAIAFAFCGTPFWGDKSADKLMGSDGDFMCVEAGLATADGEYHTISRERLKNQTTVKFDGVPVRQIDITNRFAEKDIFLSILNPLFFIEKIAGDGREFLQKLLSPIKHEDVLSLISDSTRVLIENENLLDPAYYIQNRRERLREIEENNTYIEGQRDVLKSQLFGNSDALADVRLNISNTEEKIKELKENQFDGIDVDGLQKQREGMITAISDGKLANAREMLVKAESRVYESKFNGEIANMERDLKELYASYAEIDGKIKSFSQTNICPLCKTNMLPEEAAEPIKALANQLAELVKKGKEQKRTLDELKELESKSFATFEKFKADDIARWTADIAAIPSVEPSDISAVDETLKNGNLSDDEISALSCLEAELIADKAELKALPSEDTLKNEIDKLEKSLQSGDEEMKGIRHLISAATDYAAKRAELTLAPLKMNRAEINLMDVVKSTGEVKNVFNFTYDGKDYRWLSTSEKIRAGLEVSDLLRNLTGCNYPTFIDNAESVTSMQKPQGQVLLAFVKKGAALTVEPTTIAAKEAA